MRYLLAASFCLILYSCGLMDEKIRGNGNLVTVKKPLTGFSSIRTGGSMNIQVIQSNNYDLSIHTDENLVEYLDVFVEGGTLVVRERDGYDLNPTKEVAIYVSAPQFHKISLSGSGNLTSGNRIISNKLLEMNVSGSANINMDVDVSKLVTDVSGSGSVNLKGRANELEIDLSGSGDIRCFDLISDVVSLDVSGSSDAQVTANRSLDIHVSGSADVQYKGNASVTQRISGSGSVKKVG